MTTKQLSDILNRILSHECCSRSEWAEILGVSTAALSQWANGRTIPGPDHLDALRLLVSQDSRLPEALRLDLEAVLDAPIAQVVDKPRSTMGPTLRHYLVRPRRDGAMRLLESLPPDVQEELLTELSIAARARLNPTPPPRLTLAKAVHGEEAIQEYARDVATRKQVLPIVG